MGEKAKAELRTDYLMANTSYVESVTDYLLVTNLIALQKDLNSLMGLADVYGSNNKFDAQLK